MNIARILATPSCWIRNYRACPYVSAFINAALDRGDVPKRTCEHYVELAGKRFWVENYPYAYASTHGVMPDRSTVFRLFDAVNAADWKLDTPASPAKDLT